MTKKAESSLQRKIRVALERKFGGYWIKIWSGPFQRAGFPDLLGCVDGHFIALEVKVPGGKASKLQEHTIKQIQSAGGCSAIVESVEQAVAAVSFALSTRDLLKVAGPGSSSSVHGAGHRKDPYDTRLARTLARRRH